MKKLSQFSTAENVVVEKLLDVATDDTELAISLLVEGFHCDEDEIDELGASEIFDLVHEKISQTESFSELVDAVIFSDIDDSIMKVDEAVIKPEGEIRKPCKNPCPTCPYRKDSAKGYFGGHDPKEYADAIHQDTIIACHSRTKHDKETGLPATYSDVTVCTGHIVSQIKVCKSTMHPDGKIAREILLEQDNIDELKENALGFDFKSHHGIQ